MEIGERFRMKTKSELNQHNAGSTVQRRAARGVPLRRSMGRSWWITLGRGLWLLMAANLVLLLEGFTQAQTQPPPAGSGAAKSDDENDLGPGFPRLDEPWSKGNKPAKAQPPPPVQTQPPAAEVRTPPPDNSAAVAPEETGPPPKPHVRNHEISVSGDFFLGQGNVTLPFGFSLAPLGIKPTVNNADRSSDFYGGTLSYSYKRNWYVDLNYANGSSSGSVPVSLSSSSVFPSEQSAFSIKEQYFQGYIRYAFPGLRGKSISAYLRAGVTYVQADLVDQAPIPGFGLYVDKDKTDDLLGNIGFGARYALYTGDRWQLGLQVEGEGFYGRRTQNINESLPNDPEVVLPSTKINNNLYGGIGRGTLRADYLLSRAFNLFADGGVQAKYTLIDYPSGLGSHNELLWGPYVKVGIRYSF
jgi:hypothetical protein